MKKVPINSIDLIEVLEKEYKDVLDVDVLSVGTPDYWKKAGVVELLRRLRHTQVQIKEI